MIHSDVDVISLLVSVLLTNAIKYSHPGGEVRMSVTIKDDLLKFVVSDDGVGIPSSKIPHLFSMKTITFVAAQTMKRAQEWDWLWPKGPG